MTAGPATGRGLAPTQARFHVLWWLCGAMALAYVARNAIAAAESTIRTDLSLTKTQSGWLISAFYLSYALCQIPTSQYGRHRGCREALAVFATIWSVATAAMAAATGVIGLFMTRLIEGISQAGLIPTCTTAVSKWFPMTGRAFATGALGSFMSVGGALGVWLTGLALDPDKGWGWNWRAVLLISGLPGLLWAAGFWWWYRNDPSEHASVNPQELALIKGPARIPSVDVKSSPQSSPEADTMASPSTTPWLALLSSPPLWWICGQQVCRAAAYVFFTSWFATYLQETRGVSVAKSGFLNMLPLLAVVAAGLVGGVLSDWLLKRTHSLAIARKAVGGISMLLCSGLIFLAMSIADPLAAVLVISLGSFFAALAGPCAYTITIDMGGDHVATVNATMNMMGNLGAWVFPIAVPWLLTQSGSWNGVLIVFGSLYLAGAGFWFLLNTNGTILSQSLRVSPH